MSPRRLLGRVAHLGLTLVLLASLVPVGASAADDTTPPQGTFTIGDGSGYAGSLTVTLHVPATDDVAVQTIRIFQMGVLVDERPYAPTLDWTFPHPQLWRLTVDWRDAAGNGASATASVQVDTTPPTIQHLSFDSDADRRASLQPVTVHAWDDGSPVTHVRFRTGTGAWGAPIVLPANDPRVVDWPMLDPAFGGSPVAGPRTVSAQVRNAAGLWSDVTSISTAVAFIGTGITVTGDLRTGHPVTLAPNVPAAVTWPANTTCWWELYWGNDRSLYLGERDDTFGGITISGPASKGYCKPWTVTLPWVPHRQFLVHFWATLETDTLADEWLGSHPGDPTAIRPGVDSTSRHITSSSLPMVYVLPDVYQLIVGVPATYRAYALAGEQIRSTDMWTVAYTNTPQIKYGGSVFTFTPKVAGHITVCWGSGSSRKYSISACYDPPARYPDRTRPNTVAPTATIGGARLTSGVPVKVQWSGTDAGWGIDRYQLQRSVNGGAWVGVALPSARATSIVQHLSTAASVRYRVRAVDKAGNVGYWDYGPTFRPGVVHDSSTAITWYRSWATAAEPSASGGQLRKTSVAGATATYRFSGRAIAWLAERGPGRGLVDVYLDGVRVQTVDLAAPTHSPRLIVFSRRFVAVGTHTIVLRNRATPGRREANLDAFLVLR